MVNTIRQIYGVRSSVVVNVVAGIVCGGAVAIYMGVSPALVVAVVAGLIFLVA